MFDITLPGALLAGILSFLSPCVLPLVPPYLGFLAGKSLDELAAAGGRANPDLRINAVFSTVFFVLGFSTVFIALGASATTIGQFVADYAPVLAKIAGAIIVVLGLHFLGILRIPLLYREARVHVARKPAGLIGSYIIGLAFAFGWTPCVGPVLASVLMVAGSEDTVGEGIALLAAYSAGLGVPFIIASLFVGPFVGFMQRFRRHIGTVEKIMGGLLIVTGILIMTNQLAVIGYWLLDLFPEWGRRG